MHFIILSSPAFNHKYNNQLSDRIKDTPEGADVLQVYMSVKQ